MNSGGVRQRRYRCRRNARYSIHGAGASTITESACRWPPDVPVARRERLVDHGDMRAVLGVGGSKRSPVDNADGQRVEVVLVDTRGTYAHRLGACRELESLGRDGGVLDADAVKWHGCRECRGPHSGDLSGAISQLVVKAIGACNIVSGEIGLERHQENVIRAEARTPPVLALIRAEEKDSDRHQHERERDLAADKDVSSPESRAPRIVRWLASEIADEIGTRRSPRRHETRPHRADGRDDEADQEHAIVQVEAQFQRTSVAPGGPASASR